MHMWTGSSLTDNFIMLLKKMQILHFFILIVSTSLIGLSGPELQLRKEIISEKSLIQ